MDTKFPPLNPDTSILTTLHDTMLVSAKAKAAKIISATDKKQHRKDVTKALIGMADVQSEATERPFFAKGILEK